MLYPCIFCVALVRCVFDRVCELFAETIRNMVGCGCYFVDMEVFSVGRDALLDRPCMVFQKNVCDVPVIPVCI